MRIKHTFLFTLFLGLAWAGFLFASANGPASALGEIATGVFGPTCNQAGCHVGNPLNASGGTLTLAGLPTDGWVPGQVYTLTVTIQKSGAQIYGFQLSSVFDSGSLQNRQAGTLSKGRTSGTDSTRISIVPLSGLQLAEHNQINSALAPTTQFFVNWTAPATTAGGAVRFNLAANAANRDGNDTGDFIYSRVDTIPPATGAAADFSLSAAPPSGSVVAGNNTTFSTSVTGANGFSGAVTLSVSGLPAGANAAFAPASVQSGGSSTLTVSTAASVAAGTYPLTITGVSGSLTHTASVSVTVTAPAPADFSLSAPAPSAVIVAGNSAAYTLTVAPQNGFSGSVALSVTGLPAGATGTFSAASVAAGASSTLTVGTATTVVPGTYPLTVMGVSAALTHTASLSLSVTPPPSPTKAFSITNFSSSSSSTDGTGDLGVGYARISTTAGTTPAGVEIFGFRAGGILVSETGVPASPLMTSGRIYAEAAGAVNTGLAIANPNSTPATINFFFTDSAGVDFGADSRTIPANSQRAEFLTETPYNSKLNGKTIQGTFSFTSTVPVSVIALRGYTNEVRSEFLMTTLPVIDTSVPASVGTQVLPHFVNGLGGWTTQVILVNPGVTTLTGSVQFIGQNGQSTSSPSYSVPPRSSQKLVTSGPDANGSVRVVPTAAGPAPTPLVVFSFKPGAITISEAGAPANAGGAFRMYVESSGIAGQPGNIQSGIAVANGADASATVTFELFNLNGTTTGLPLPQSKVLPASGQYASFLAELFPTLPQPFKGVLRISSTSSVSSTSTVSVVGLRGRYNERSEFLITTTPPTLESAPASAAELLFPHLVNGGGYTTQFILFSGTAGQTSTGTLRFFTQAGIPLGLVLP